MNKGSEKESSSTFIENIKQYIDLKSEYIQLSFAEKVSLLAGKMVLMIFSAILCLAIILLFMVLIYHLLMNWIGIDWVVTLIEIGILGLLMCLMWCFRLKLVIRPVANMIIRVLFGSDTNKNGKDN